MYRGKSRNLLASKLFFQKCKPGVPYVQTASSTCSHEYAKSIDLQEITLFSIISPIYNSVFGKMNIVWNHVNRCGRSGKIFISARTFFKGWDKAESEWKILGPTRVKWQSENYKWFSGCSVSHVSRTSVKLCFLLMISHWFHSKYLFMLGVRRGRFAF
jgi:hypothetical protein